MHLPIQNKDDDTPDGYIPFMWSSENDRYFLRDDRDAGVTTEERYSLFRVWPTPYIRVVVLNGPLCWALAEAGKWVKKDRESFDKSTS